MYLKESKGGLVRARGSVACSRHFIVFQGGVGAYRAFEYGGRVFVSAGTWKNGT